MWQDKKTKELKRLTFYNKHIAKTRRNDKGVLVFEGTNLSVFQIGSLLSNGVTKVEILNDYPYLTVDDLTFATMFYSKESA